MEETDQPQRKYGTPVPTVHKQFRFCQRCHEWVIKSKSEIVCLGKEPLNTKDAKEEFANFCFDCIEEVLDGITKNER